VAGVGVKVNPYETPVRFHFCTVYFGRPSDNSTIVINRLFIRAARDRISSAQCA
jgi:hypothetical protein